MRGCERGCQRMCGRVGERALALDWPSSLRRSGSEQGKGV